jgi:hypothetical protein
MTRFLVAARFAWAEYPGLRAGRLYAGTDDVARHPRGEAHLVDGPDAAETLCGLPRTTFPHAFPWPGPLAEPCPDCRAAGAS